MHYFHATRGEPHVKKKSFGQIKFLTLFNEQRNNFLVNWSPPELEQVQEQLYQRRFMMEKENDTQKMVVRYRRICYITAFALFRHSLSNCKAGFLL